MEIRKGEGGGEEEEEEEKKQVWGWRQPVGCTPVLSAVAQTELGAI